MDNKELEKITESIKQKLGDDVNATIGDDIASLFTLNKESINKINSLQSDLDAMKSRNELLVNANSRLLQQVPSVSEANSVNNQKQSDENTNKLQSFNLMDAFDEKGNFKKKL